MQKHFNKNDITIVTEIDMIDVFYFGEDYHQQYLYKHPKGYCGLKGVGCQYPRNDEL